MNSQNNNMNKMAFHEDIIMPNNELPIKFIEHNYNIIGPFVILHWHNELEMVYVKQGSVSVRCNNDTIETHAGDIIYINSNEPHSYSITSAPIVLYCCIIDPVLLQGRYITSYDSQFISPNSTFTIFKNHIKDDPLLEQNFLTMWKEGIQKVIGYEYAIKANLYGIIALMVRNHTRSTLSNKQFQYKNRNLHNINKVIEYIEKNYQKDLNLDSLADFLGYNRYYFCRLFKETTSCSPVQYINNFRIHQAISLMQQNPDLSITQVAIHVGFNDSNYFARVFKNVIGETPSIYLNKIKERLEE